MVAFDGEFMGLKILTDFKFHEESVAGEFGEDFFDGSADAGPLEALHGHPLVSGRSEEDRLGVGREEVHFGGVAGLEGEFFAEFLFGGLPEGLASQDGGGGPRSGICCGGRGIFGVLVFFAFLVFLIVCWWGGALGTFNATKVEVEDTDEFGNEIEAEGSVQAITASTITINSQTFSYNAQTQMEDETNVSAPLNMENIMSRIMVNSYASVDGYLNSTGTLIATRIEIDNDIHSTSSGTLQ